MVNEASAVMNTVTETNVSCFAAMDGAVANNTTGGVAPYVYAWSNGATTANISGLDAGMYMVTITDANGCTLVDTANITEPAEIVLNLGADTSVCLDATLTLDAGMSAMTYLWSDGSTASTLNVPTSMVGVTSYSVTVTNMGGCAKSDTIEVTVLAPINLEITGDTNLCANDMSVLDAGAGYTTYMWSTGASTQTVNVDASTLAAGSYPYSVTVTNAGGCSATTLVNVSVSNPVVVDLGPDTVITDLSVNNFVLDAGAGFASYLWSDNQTTTQLFNVLRGSGGEFSVIVTDANGCTGTDTIMVDFVTSVAAMELGDVKIYPNPATDFISVEITNVSTSNNIVVSIYSTAGDMVKQQAINSNGKEARGVINVSDLATGTYMVRFESNGQVTTKTFVIK